MARVLRRVRRWFQLMARFGLPLALIVPVAASIYEHSHSWQLADAKLPNRPGQTRVMVGEGYSSKTAFNSTGRVTERTGSYFYYPEVLKTQEVYTLSQKGDGEVVVTSEHFSPVGQLFGLLVVVALTAVSWIYPLPRRDR